MPKKDYDLVFDWFECTFKHASIHQVLDDFGLDIYSSGLTIINTGLFGYNTTFIVGEKIKFMVRLPDQGEFKKGLSNILINYDRNMGVHFILSGYACREFEMRYNWWWLIKYCVENNANISRIDIAWDCFNNELIRIPRIIDYLKSGRVVTKAKKALIFDEVETENGTTTGESVKFGSSSSEMMCMIYNKLQERKSADYVIDPNITYWVRIELRIRGASANNFIECITQASFHYQANAALNNYLNFKEKSSDTNRSRWESVDWWSEFIRVADKLKLSDKAIQTTIQQKMDWISMSVTKTLSKVFLSNYEEYYGDQFYKLFYEGIHKIKEMDIDQINAFRIEKGGSILTGEDMYVIKKQIEAQLDETQWN